MVDRPWRDSSGSVTGVINERTWNALKKRWDSIQQARQRIDRKYDRIMKIARNQKGDPYGYGSAGPNRFDCSGLTSYAWRMAGVTLPRSSRDQMRAAETRDAWTALPGDLVYFPGHVMMSLGLPNAVVHSPQSGRVVEVEIYGGRRADSLRYADPLA